MAGRGGVIRPASGPSVMMIHGIALNGSFFNTQRMVLQYVLRAYFE
jgi:hypothetical protein